MSDLERALRDTLADPPVEPEGIHNAEWDIHTRISRRRSRQKRAAGLGAAAMIAAAIAIPVGTGGIGGGGGSSHSNSAARSESRSGAGAEKQGPGPAGPQAQQAPTPAAVRTSAATLARRYGKPDGPVRWVRTTKSAVPGPAGGDGTSHESVYVLQAHGRFTCDAACAHAGVTTTAGSQGTVLTAVVSLQGQVNTVTLHRPVDLPTLGTVHTFVVR